MAGVRKFRLRRSRLSKECGGNIDRGKVAALNFSLPEEQVDAGAEHERAAAKRYSEALRQESDGIGRAAGGPVALLGSSAKAERRVVALDEPARDEHGLAPEAVAQHAPDAHQEEARCAAGARCAEEEVLFRFRVGVGLELDEADDEQRDAD